jgi:predicted nucleic acid-binding protein
VRLTDVNVLVYAYREDAADHAAYRQWLQAMLDSQQAFAM